MKTAITPEEMTRRRENVEAAYRSVAMETVPPSDEMMADAERYIRGEIELDEIGMNTSVSKFIKR